MTHCLQWELSVKRLAQDWRSDDPVAVLCTDECPTWVPLPNMTWASNAEMACYTAAGPHAQIDHSLLGVDTEIGTKWQHVSGLKHANNRIDSIHCTAEIANGASKASNMQVHDGDSVDPLALAWMEQTLAEASILNPVPGTETMWDVWSPETKNDIFEDGEPLWPHTSMIDLHHTVGVSMSTFADMTLRI